MNLNQIFRFVVSAFLVAALNLPNVACSPEAWRAAQQTMNTVNRYVSDGMAALSIVLAIVEGVAPSETLRDIRAAVSVAQTVLREEADIVEDQSAPLTSAAEVSRAFPRFIEAWQRIKAAVESSGLLRGAVTVGERTNGYREVTLVDPLVVRRSR